MQKEKKNKVNFMIKKWVYSCIFKMNDSGSSIHHDIYVPLIPSKNDIMVFNSAMSIFTGTINDIPKNYINTSPELLDITIKIYRVY